MADKCSNEQTENIVSEESLTTAIEYLKEEKMFCFIHQHNEVSMFCKSCDRLVCTSCVIAGDHSNHKFCEIDDIITEKREKFNERMNKTQEETIRTLQQNIRIVTMQKENVRKNCKNVSAEIDDRKMELSQMLESWSQHQQSIVTTQQEKQLQNLDKSLLEAERCQAIFEHFRKNPLSSKDFDGKKLVYVLEIFQKATSASTRNMSEFSLEGNEVTFTMEPGTADHLEKWFGHVTGVVSESNPEKIMKFKFCDSQINQMSPIDAKRAFVVTENKLYLVDSTEVDCTLTNFEPLMTNVKYITPMTDRGIYVQQTDSYVIKRVTSDGQVRHFADFKHDQFHPSQSLRISHTGMILSVKRFDDSFRNNIMMFQEYDKNGVKSKTVQNICCQYKEDFIYSVHTAEAVYVLNTSKELPTKPYQPGCVANVETATKYKGVIGPDPANTFHPRGLCRDQDDHLIVSDFWNHAIHKLTRDGKFQKFLMTEDEGLMYPTAVGIDNLNWLWIAQSDGHIHIKYIR